MSDEIVDAVCEAFRHSPGKSTRRASNKLRVPQSIVVKILRKYEAYSESKDRFAVKKKLSKVSYKILLLSDNTFFKLFFRIFVAIIEAS